METETIVNVAAKVLTWMRANVVDELEPRYGGTTAGSFLIALTKASQRADAADDAALIFAAEVLAQYGTHDHATAGLPPTPKDAATAAADDIRKKVADAAEAQPAEEAVPASLAE